MGYGYIEYDDDGLPICEICGESFNRLGTHLRNSHKILSSDYKRENGLNQSQGLCSAESAEKSRIAVMKKYNTCIYKNLIKKGENTRFKDGGPGRTSDKVTEQTKIVLRERMRKMREDKT